MYSCSFPAPRSIFNHPSVGESCKHIVPPRLPSKQAVALNNAKLELNMSSVIDDCAYITEQNKILIKPINNKLKILFFINSTSFSIKN